jgi:hypothetical protein
MYAAQILTFGEWWGRICSQQLHLVCVALSLVKVCPISSKFSIHILSLKSHQIVTNFEILYVFAIFPNKFTYDFLGLKFVAKTVSAKSELTFGAILVSI